MAVYVLVHGAWSGAHGFHLVRPMLSAAGHEVFTPSLTGVGERVHLASPQVDLTTHVQDVVNVLLYEDLHDVVLLGFSYGGFVVAGALQHVADRVRHVVLLDAFLPEDGDTVADHLGQPAERVVALGADWLVPAAPRGFDDPAEAAFAVARRTPHPRACFTEPLRLGSRLEDLPLGRTYVKATADADDGPGARAFRQAAERARSSPLWEYHEVDSNHMVASNRPAELAALLLALA